MFFSYVKVILNLTFESYPKILTLTMLFYRPSFLLLLLIDYLQFLKFETRANVYAIHSNKRVKRCDVLIVYVVCALNIYAICWKVCFLEYQSLRRYHKISKNNIIFMGVSTFIHRKYVERVPPRCEDYIVYLTKF